MCGRFNVTSDPLAELLMTMLGQSMGGSGHEIFTNFNVAPTLDVAVIRPQPGENAQRKLELQAMRWWLTPSWLKEWSKEISTRYAMFNARSETLEKSSAYREPFKQRRCVVPISGFYEWVSAGGQKIPYYIRPADDRGMLLAGIWDSWRSREEPTAEPLLSFSVVTTKAHPSLEFVHKRQPVMLDSGTARQWMDEATSVESLTQLMLPALPRDTLAIPVSSYVNNARHSGSRCIEAVADAVELPAAPCSTAGAGSQA